MTEEQTLPDRTPKTKRSRKPATPRTRKPKDPGILAIEQAAAKQKDEYRKAQASGAILKRIMDKMLPKLTEAHQQELRQTMIGLFNTQNADHLRNPPDGPSLERTGIESDDADGEPYGKSAH